MMHGGFLALAVLTCATASAATADAVLSIPLKIGATDSVNSIAYSCDDGDALSVQYVNAGANALAILPIDGEDRIFVNAVSASGARYVSGAYVWWTKGNAATLENELQAGSIESCHAQGAAPSE